MWSKRRYSEVICTERNCFIEVWFGRKYAVQNRSSLTGELFRLTENRSQNNNALISSAVFLRRVKYNKEIMERVRGITRFRGFHRGLVDIFFYYKKRPTRNPNQDQIFVQI